MTLLSDLSRILGSWEFVYCWVRNIKEKEKMWINYDVKYQIDDGKR